MKRAAGCSRRFAPERTTKNGFARFEEYIEALFGYGPRFVRERLRVAEGLEELSKTSQALSDGQACWSVVRELTRVATPETEEAWLLATRGKSARQVEQMVSGRARGDLPDTPARPEAQRHVLRLELSAETMATYREAVAKLQREAGSGLSEDEALLMMARHVLEGPKDQGRASYQIAMSVCPECEQGRQQGRGELLPLGPEVLEMATCDAQRVGETHMGASGVGRARATQDIPPATRRQVMLRAGGRCQVPSCRCSTFVDLHHLRPRSEGGDHDPDRIIVLCAAHHRAVHRGALWIEGTVREGLRFRHADGTTYGSVTFLDPETAKVHTDTFEALRSLGFNETESRRALASLRKESQTKEATFDGVLRGALRLLRPPIAEVPISVREPRARYRVSEPRAPRVSHRAADLPRSAKMTGFHAQAFRSRRR